MIYKYLSYILFFLFLLISVLQGLFFYNTYHLHHQQIETRLEQSLIALEQTIEKHEINRHKELFGKYRQEYLCAPEKDSFTDITFRIYSTDTFNNLQELSETINRKLSKQAINSSAYMIAQLPIDTNFIDSTLQVHLKSIDENINVQYELVASAQQTTLPTNHRIKLFDDYRFYSPIYLVLSISGINRLLFNQLFVTLFSCLIILLLFFLATRYTYFTLIKYKQLADSKTEFISHLAHEIKTPLTSIYISSQALKDDRLNKDHDTVNKYAHAIHYESERLQRQLENVLHLSASERQFLVINKTPTDLNELVITVTKLFQIRIQDVAGNLHLQFNHPKNIVSIDPTHFGNVLYNLIDNAIKYSRTKPLYVSIEILQDTSNLILKITDKGIGIDHLQQQKVFDVFYKAHNNMSGFGVGLHYVKLITEAHGGHISLNSEVNMGTTFTISIPL